MQFINAFFENITSQGSFKTGVFIEQFDPLRLLKGSAHCVEVSRAGLLAYTMRSYASNERKRHNKALRGTGQCTRISHASPHSVPDIFYVHAACPTGKLYGYGHVQLRCCMLLLHVVGC